MADSEKVRKEAGHRSPTAGLLTMFREIYRIDTDDIDGIHTKPRIPGDLVERTAREFASSKKAGEKGYGWQIPIPDSTPDDWTYFGKSVRPHAPEMMCNHL